jgi:F-type H+-transporting ATPase subunit epsilon
MASLNVRAVSPGALLFEGAANSVIAPAWDGKVGILPGHTQMITLLGSGEVSINLPEGDTHSLFIGGGVLRIDASELTILAEQADSELTENLLSGTRVDVDAILEAMEDES